MFEIDLLPIEPSPGVASTRSGDAIALRFTPAGGGRPKVVVIDAGFHDTGKNLVEHIRRYYDTTDVDLVISTHPDGDHIGGLRVVLDELDVGELLVHQPRLHASNVADFRNIEAVDTLLETARRRGVPISSPFTGLTRFDRQLRILGPTQGFYEQMVHEHLADVAREQKTAARGQVLLSQRTWSSLELLESLPFLPEETLTDDVVTDPRNNSSVVTLLEVGEARMLLTADAGIPALEAAADEYEARIRSFAVWPLSFMQVPHHGSRHNVGPTILNRLLGSKDGTPFAATSAVVSSAKADLDHPTPAVVNAFARRGCYVVATEGKTVCHSDGSAVNRPGWSQIPPLPALDESGDDDD